MLLMLSVFGFECKAFVSFLFIPELLRRNFTVRLLFFFVVAAIVVFLIDK